MTRAGYSADNARPKVVGSFGSLADLTGSSLEGVRESCDLVEIRLDLLVAECGRVEPVWWSHLLELPLLFTARVAGEGGAGSLDAAARTKLLMEVLDDASLIDIEVASVPEMSGLLDAIRARGIPWVASFHDFTKLPETSILSAARDRALDAGATVFKTAAMLHSPADLARLAEFQLARHGIPVSTMGMGVLAPVSRLLCAQCGSVLNYGYLGRLPTAPGQWDGATLKSSIAGLAAFQS